ncbi:MAG: membrane protein insertase YidC [Micavibrio sp.]|nr:membrane protein insertase YidC [Micavibrio sp.]
MSANKKGDMHPGDMRNLIIFVLVAIIIWAAFDHFIMGPKTEALREAQKQNTQNQTSRTLETAGNTPQNTSIDTKRDRNEVLSESANRISFDAPEIDGSILLKGARIDDLSLKNYYKTLEKEEEVSLLSPVGSEYPYYAETGWVSAQPNITVPGPDTEWSVVGGNADLTPESPVTLRWQSPQGLIFTKQISVDEHYLFTVNDSVTNTTVSSVTLFPYGAVARRGRPANLQDRAIVHEGPLGYFDGNLEEPGFSDMDDTPVQSFKASSGWIGFGQKYWVVSLLPEQNSAKTFRFVQSPSRDANARALYQSDFTGQGMEIATGETVGNETHIYAGAKKVKILDAYEQNLGVKHFDLAVDFGILYFLTRPFYWLLTTFYDLVGNFGVAIIMLTFLLRLAVFPLANASFRSFAKLKKVAPQMTELRDRYKDDKAKLQKEMVKLYEKEKVNPMAGCFPILLQIPIFFAMYKVIYITLEMRHAPFFGWIQDLSQPDPTSIFNLFGLLPYDPPSFLMIGIWPCIMLFFMVLQQKLNPPPQDPIQKTMMKYFPFFITFILSGFAAGLVIYWTVSNALSVLQQMIIMKSMGVPIHLFDKSATEEKLDKQIEDGPAIHPRMEMVEEDVEEALFGDEESDSGKDSSDKPEKK